MIVDNYYSKEVRACQQDQFIAPECVVLRPFCLSHEPSLGGEDDSDAAAARMRPAPNDLLRAWPVYRPSGVAFGPRAVNDVRRDGPELLEPVE